MNVNSFRELEPDVVANDVTAVPQLCPQWTLMQNSRGGIGPDAHHGKPGTRERVTVAPTVAAFGSAHRVESPWLDWCHSDNDQGLTALELRHAQ